jgi:hypothetical protein
MCSPSIIRASLTGDITLPLFFNSGGHGYDRVRLSSDIHPDPIESIVLRAVSHGPGAEDQVVSTHSAA